MSGTNVVMEAHASSSSKLTVRTFSEESDGLTEQYVLLEGDPEALRFLAELILAHVNSDEGCGRFIHPNGPGSIHFDDKSTTGIYIHKLPCDLGHPSALGESVAGKK
jgi:hypothetical protein